MSDLPYIQRTDEVKIVGQDSTGNTVNYVGADSNGNMAVKDSADGPVTPGTVASNSILTGGQFNTSLPTLTNGQQVALQVDSSARQIIAPLTNSSVVKAQLQDNAGNGITSNTVGGKTPLDHDIVGATDGTRIGNTTDRLKVDVGNFLPASRLLYADMNVANGGIARGTAITTDTTDTVFSYTGAGVIFGFTINLAALTGGTGWQLDLEVDGTKVFGSSGISTVDIFSNTVYDIGNIAADIYGTLGFSIVDKSLRWTVPNGSLIKFNTSLVLKVTNNGAGGASQVFHAGLMLYISGTI